MKREPIIWNTVSQVVPFLFGIKKGSFSTVSNGAGKILLIFSGLKKGVILNTYN